VCLCVGNEWGNPEKKTGHEMTAVISCPVSALKEKRDLIAQIPSNKNPNQNTVILNLFQDPEPLAPISQKGT